MSTTPESREYDVVVVGSGGGGLVAAITATDNGLRTLVLEKGPLVGGTTAKSGGVFWVNNFLMQKEGVPDSIDDAFTYIDTLADESDVVFSERRRSFVESGPKMAEFLRSKGVKFVRAEGFPDHFVEQPGGHARGRGLEVRPYDINRLGSWRQKLRPSNGNVRHVKRMKAHTHEVRSVALARINPKAWPTFARVFTRSAAGTLRRQRLAVCGEGLVAWLLDTAVKLGVEIWTNSPLLSIQTEGGRVVVVTTRHENETVTIRATKGVVLASGGYARSDEMRARYARQPSSRTWSQANDNDTADAIPMVGELGAALVRIEDGWYIPTSVSPDGRAVPHQPDRTRPHSIIVDSSGSRFVNEALDPKHVGMAMYKRNEVVPAIPCWLVIDDEHRRRYPFVSAARGKTPPEWIESGYMKKADTLEELAAACGIDAKGLVATVDRFNALVHAGHDDDFNRGDTFYEHYYGDPRAKPNPALGDISKAPFYAIAIYPAKCGGVLTDGNARVLREDRSVIEGLYAVGNNALEICGGRNFGPGASISTTMTFGFIAATHLSRNEPSPAARH